MKAYALLFIPLALVPLYLLFVLSGFMHEGGHIAAGNWVDVEVTDFSPTECLRLSCRVFPLEPVEGWRGRAVLFAGGLAASLGWLAVYVVTMRWHRKRAWWVGALAAAVIAGELTNSLLEGGWEWLYTNHELAALLMIILGMAVGFAAQLKATGQLFHTHQI